MGDNFKKSVRKHIRSIRNASYRKSTDFANVNEEVLTEFDISERKRQELMSLLKKHIEDVKVKEFRRPVELEYPKIVRKNRSHEQMLEHAQKLPTAKMTKCMKLAILKAIGAPKLEHAWQDVKSSVMGEVEDQFLKVVHQVSAISKPSWFDFVFATLFCSAKSLLQVGVNSRVKPLDGTDSHVRLPPYKRMGRSPNYGNYLKTRSDIKKKLFISYPLMRKILDRCITNLPEVLVDFSKYRNVAYEINELSDTVSKEITNQRKFIITFHNKIVRLTEKNEQNNFKGVSSKYHYWRTGTSIISSNMIRLLKNTIKHIANVTGEIENVPFLKLYLRYEHKLTLFPSVDDTINMYMNFVNNVVIAADNLETLEGVYCKQHEGSLISTFIEEEFLHEAGIDIRNNLSVMFLPVQLYTDNLENEYSSVYGGEFM